MKSLFSILLLICFFSAKAQKPAKLDTIYYWVDTTKTPEKERMWNIFVESTTKCFEIECPCMKYNLKPTFAYKENKSGQILTEEQFKKLNTVKITTLIDIAKGDIGKLQTYPIIIFIEKEDVNYVTHKVYLIEPQKPRINIDSVTTPVN